MYRYSVDQAVIYTSDDIVLFRESPFACWMERLTLENSGHGIPPDVGSLTPQSSQQAQSELTTTLKDEGKDVIAIDWETDEAGRRTATLAAMRHGLDFIVNGQLAVGPLSDSVNLLMRTSGYSELGNYLYMPCDTQLKTNLSSAFRLCFLADLLHSLQGQLPPQMLILRGNSDVIPLQSEDHIYHYRAVKQRFMSAQAAFKKHQIRRRRPGCSAVT
jgi:predicted RecB family nuclease